MIIQFQLTPLTILLPLAVLLCLVAIVATKSEGSSIGSGLYVLAVWAGAVFIWSIAAVVVLAAHLYFHFA